MALRRKDKKAAHECFLGVGIDIEIGIDSNDVGRKNLKSGKI